MGRSTTCIASGLRDWLTLQDLTPDTSPRSFVTVDIFPVGWGFVAKGLPWATGAPHYWNLTAPDTVTLMIYGEDTSGISHTVSYYNARFAAMFDTGSHFDWLRYYLRQNSVDHLVTITAATKLLNIGYRVVWSDASHNEDEIAANFPSWLALAKPGIPIVYALHDINAKLEVLVRKLFTPHCDIDSTFRADTIFAMELVCWRL
jgi:hypothetical protein